MSKVKYFFSSPKRTAILAVLAAVLLVVAGICSLFVASTVAENDSIGAEAAINIALYDAGYSHDDSSNATAHFTRRDGKYVFEVSFVADGQSYSYVLDASLGSILSRGITDDKTPATPTILPQIITPEQAIDIALSDARVDDTVSFDISVGEDGLSYEISFTTASEQYKYVIDAVSSVIKEMQVDSLGSVTPPATGDPLPSTPTPPNTSGDPLPSTSTPTPTPTPTLPPVVTPTPTTNTFIGVDRAKQISVGDAGFNVGEVTFDKVKLENDNGVFIYDIEFIAVRNGVKYECEYEIDARTGYILDRDIDIDE